MTRLFNFSPGPATLPETVLEMARDNMLSLGPSGIGILEQSHRGTRFREILAVTEANCRVLGDIPEDYTILFLQGGASLQFAMVPANLRIDPLAADYLVSGHWSTRALHAAACTGEVHVAASGEGTSFSRLPRNAQYSQAPAYVHYTSNNTIVGTQYQDIPGTPTGVPLVCDASSDIFSRPLDVSAHGLIYAGAQKNLGIAGLTLVIVRNDLLALAPETLPPILRYRTHATAGSLFNTPPVFSIYIAGLVLQWLADQGGLDQIDAHNRQQASRLYDRIDTSTLFSAFVEGKDRSQMNVTFSAGTAARDDHFLATCTDAGLVGLKGHRSVGGLRASLYNALPNAAVDRLLNVIDEFEANPQR